jgi:small-conductance mechanosensitive channel
MLWLSELWGHYSPLLIPLLVIGGAFFGLMGLRWLGLRVLSGSPMGRAVSHALKAPSVFWAIAIAINLGIDVSTLPAPHIDKLNTAIQVMVLFSVTLAVGNLVVTATLNFLTKIQSPLAHNGLMQAIIKVFIFILGGLVILSRIGIHIAPLLTALGVGGLAMSLALQDTLGNLFAGMSLLLERSILVGDRIKLESGPEGIIEDIGWRTTKLRLSPEDLLIIPNTKLAQNIATRRSKR